MFQTQLLEAYCDGEAAEEDVRRIEAEMANDPDLVARIDRLFAQRAAVHAAFEDFLARPADDRTEQMIRARLAAPAAAPEPAPDLATDNVVAFPARGARAPGRLQQLWWPAAIAASLVIGVFGGRMIAPPQTVNPDAAPAALAAALDQTPSGQARTVGAERFQVSLSFADRTGAPCRQFALRGETRDLSGLACRRSDGWRLQALISGPASQGSDFQTAAGPGEDAVSRIADGMIAGAPFDQAEEARRIARHWGR